MNNENYLDYTFSANSGDLDLYGRLKPASILGQCEKSAQIHSANMGLGYERLKELGVTWVLSRIKVECQRLPVWGEDIRVRTWHKCQVGLFSIRDYIFYDQQNNEIIKVTSSWVAINIATRRLTRIDRLFSDGSLALMEYSISAIDAEAPKIELPTQQSLCLEHSVSYSDLDINNHVNNARYLEWICDVSPMQLDFNKSLSSIVINFNHEAILGEAVILNKANPSENKIMIEGRIGNKSVMTAELEYK